MHEVFQTGLLPPQDRQDAWRLHHSRLFPSVRFRSQGAGSASAEHWRAGEISLVRYRCYPHDVVQTSQSKYLKLLLPTRAGTTYSNDGSCVSVNAGDLIVYDMNNQYAINNAYNVDHRLVLLPQSFVHRRGRQEGALGKRGFYHFDRSSALGRLLAEFIVSTFSTIDRLSETQMQAAGDVICHLLRAVLEDAAEKTVAPSSLQYIHERAVKIINQSVRDHELTVDELVRKLNCCRRSLYAAFDGTGYTPKEMILSKRLEGVRSDLRRSDLRGRSILEIIYSWGFEEQKSFCRLFKERYGITASAYRRKPD